MTGIAGARLSNVDRGAVKQAHVISFFLFPNSAKKAGENEPRTTLHVAARLLVPALLSICCSVGASGVQERYIAACADCKVVCHEQLSLCMPRRWRGYHTVEDAVSTSW